MIERATYDLQEYTQTHAYRSHLKTFIINLSHLKEKCRLAYPKKSDVPPIRMLKVLAIPFFLGKWSNQGKKCHCSEFSQMS